MNTLKDYQTNITVYDPWANPAEVKHEYGWDSVTTIDENCDFDAVILTVAHNEFKSLDLTKLCKNLKVVYDVKGILPAEVVDRYL